MSNDASPPFSRTPSHTAEIRSSGVTSSGQIVIVAQPPSHLFWDQWFQVGITAKQYGQSVDNNVIHIEPELVACGSTMEGQHDGDFGIVNVDHNNADLIIEGEELISVSIPSSTSSTSDAVDNENVSVVRCKIQRRGAVPGINSYSIRFVLHESTKDKESSDVTLSESRTARSFMPAHTTTIKMVTSKLQLVTDDWPDIWYKDEGGRDKCIQVTAQLVDSRDQPVLSRCFQLHLTLVYDNDTRSPVMRQDKLRILGPRKNYIDPETGSAILLFRIEDVSKNHQGLRFMICVDTEPSIDDVAPTFTPAVSVRSKRNKRGRDIVPIDVDAPQSGSNILPDSFTSSSRLPHEAEDLSDVQHALKMVIEWSNAVVQGLNHHRWNVLGYSPRADGSLDYNQPYHSMQNPNEFISKIMFMYKNDIQQKLTLLQKFLDSLEAQVGRPLVKKNALSPQHVSTATTTTMIPTPLSISYRSPLKHHQELLDLPSTMSPQQYVTPCTFSASRMQQSAIVPQHQITHTNILPMITPRSAQSSFKISSSSNDSEYDEARSNNIYYILAKQFKSISTGERLGLPAFNEAKHLLGFYVESDRKLGAGSFVPLDNHTDFGPKEILQAKVILEQSLEKNSQAVHMIKNYDSLASMLDHALVYMWTKEIQADKDKTTG